MTTTEERSGVIPEEVRDAFGLIRGLAERRELEWLIGFCLEQLELRGCYVLKMLGEGRIAGGHPHLVFCLFGRGVCIWVTCGRELTTEERNTKSLMSRGGWVCEEVVNGDGLVKFLLSLRGGE